MSQPVKQPTGNYQRPLEGPIHTCPHCGKILNQHFAADPQAAAPPAPAPELSISANGIIDLFGGGVTPLVDERSPGGTVVVHGQPQLAEAEPPHLVASGDLFVPSDEPQVIRRPEQVAAGQHRPEKAQTHVIHGMKPAVKEEAPPPRHGQADALSSLDHPVIGGKVTIVVCCYGEEHHNLHRRCLNSIVRSVPPSRMDLRVIANQVSVDSINYFRSLPVAKVYPDHKTRRKYPAMRQVFYDTEQPIDTNYVVWFDDDSYVLNEAWLSILAEVIGAQKPAERVGMYGHLMYHPLRPTKPGQDPRAWFRNGTWFRGQHFRNKQGRGVPNGDKIHFCVGGFWALSTECMRACQIPDARLNHNGGDICIGEQVYQGGYKMKQFNENKQYVKTSGAPRRGFREKFPWYR